MLKYGNTQSKTIPGPELIVEVYAAARPQHGEKVACLIDTLRLPAFYLFPSWSD